MDQNFYEWINFSCLSIALGLSLFLLDRLWGAGMDWLKKVLCSLVGHSSITTICTEENYKLICMRCGRRI